MNGNIRLISRYIQKLPSFRQVANFSIDQIGQNNAEQPFDYVNKRYGAWNQIFYSTLCNIGDNTLFVCVDGNLGSGKSRLAKQLADKIGFLYIPPPNVDTMYYEQQNFNMKTLFNECVLPDRTMLNRNDWLNECNIHTTIRYYYYETLTRIYQYRMALIHMMSTGQGIVMDGSYWSDIAFAKSLHSHKLISDIGYEAYDELRQMYDYELKRPHLIIYLEQPVEECLSNIHNMEKSNFQPQSKLFEDDKFLKLVEKEYENKFLESITDYSHILRYKYANVVDNPLWIAEDMEKINFEDKCKDWRITSTSQLDNYRYSLTSRSQWNRMHMKLTKFIRVPELTVMGEEANKVKSLLKNHPEFLKKTGYSLSFRDQIKMYFKLVFDLEQPRPFY